MKHLKELGWWIAFCIGAGVSAAIIAGVAGATLGFIERAFT